jgi:hypothetical protein
MIYGHAYPPVISVLSPLPALPLPGRELCGDVRLHLLQQNLSFGSALLR